MLKDGIFTNIWSTHHLTFMSSVLGQDASRVLQIVNELGNQRTIKIRIRGIGSGFREGPQHQELPEPLHFNVSAEDEALLKRVVERVQSSVELARRELGA